MNVIKRDYRFDLLRLFCNLMIVFYHATFFGIGVECVKVSPITRYLARGLAWTMPTFFLLTGYLLLRGLNPETYKAKLTRRVRSLLYPYVAWNLIYACIATLADHNWSALGFLCSVVGIGRYPACSQFWYIREIILLALFAPLFRFVFQKRSLTILLFCGLLAANAVSACFNLDVRGEPYMPTYSIICFSIGAYLGCKGLDLMTFFAKCRWLHIVIWLLVAFPISQYDRWMGWMSVGTFAALFGILPQNPTGTLASILRNRYFSFISNSAFFIYALHLLLISRLIPYAIRSNITPTSLTALPIVATVFGLTIILALITRGVLQRLFPRFEKLLSGRL